MESEHSGGRPEEQESEESTFLSINEAAEKSGYDPNWIWRLANTGKIKSRTESRRILIERTVSVITVSLKDLQDWEEENRGPQNQ